MAKKVKNIFDLVSDCRKHSMSKDETRSFLMGVYFDETEKVCVTTNGHILTKSKILYVEEFKGLIVMPDFTVNKREYPRWQTVIPTKEKFQAVFTIETKHILKAKNPLERAIYFQADGTISLERTKDFAFAIDSDLVKPLVGHTVKMGWNPSTKKLDGLNEKYDKNDMTKNVVDCPSLNPIVVHLGYEFGDNYNDEIFIVMPIKMDWKE